MPDPVNPAVTRAVVKAIGRLTTQVGRIADALTTPVVEDAEAQRTTDDDALRRAELAEAELRTLRSGIRSLGGDPTTIQNLWAQIRLRNRQWAEAKRERDKAQATVARVRAECDAIARDVRGKNPVALAGFREANARIRAALDGLTEEQPDA